MFPFCLINYQITIYTNSYQYCNCSYKKASKIYRFCALQVIFFSLKFVEIVFISSSYDSITLSQIIAESSAILAECFPFSQLQVAGFQT